MTASRNLGKIVLMGLLWLVTAVAGLAMVEKGWGKFRSFDGWWFWFGQFGFPGWFSPIIGGLEILGGVLLFIPKLASYSAIVLIGIMIVAFYSVITTPHTALSPIDPIVNSALFLVICAGWWHKRLRR